MAAASEEAAAETQTGSSQRHLHTLDLRGTDCVRTLRTPRVRSKPATASLCNASTSSPSLRPLPCSPAGYLSCAHFLVLNNLSEEAKPVALERGLCPPELAGGWRCPLVVCVLVC